MAGRSRRKEKEISAKDVAEILRRKLLGQPWPQIQKETGLNSGSFWTLAKSGWAKQNLATCLSKKADYAEFRAEIQKAVNKLGYYEGELPEPAPSKARMTADVLASALEMMLSRDETLGRKPLTEIAEKLGVTPDALYRWITKEAKPCKAAKSFQNLPGYDQHATRLIECFRKLNYVAFANDLCAARGDQLLDITLEILLEVLHDIATKPGLALRTIAAARGFSVHMLSPFITAKGIVVATPERLAQLPDYGEHVDALRLALEKSRQSELASQLKPASVPAAEFIQTCRENFGRLMSAVERMASNPAADLLVEAERCALPPNLLVLLFDSAGALRSKAAIHERLADLKDYLRPGIEDMLDRIAARHAGAAVQAPDKTMMRIDMTHGSKSVPDRVVLVQPGSQDPGPSTRGRLAKIFENSPSLVQEPRSFATQRPRQVLRWLSTILKERFGDGFEVQCYFDSTRNLIVVSSNSDGVNKKISQFLRDGALKRWLESEGRPLPPDAPRELRHAAKLLRRMDPSIDGFRSADHVLAAIAEGRFEVPRKSYKTGTLSVRLHAERRIKRHVEKQGGGPLDLNQLAGTMRPCGTCAEDLSIPPEAHRGPFWFSDPSRYEMDIDHVIAQNQRAGIGTSVTRVRGTRAFTFDHDTDSDSDLDA